ncbi:glycogen debranching N-terminal domain-containing protein [Carboxydochorda subterranea]|uniref:Glycogen debranching N-terminal domain-containing protein n=1 Tax=Carboxydichorda subterranea TaxID=3109565 RepID=A0ABZ1BYD0_9FIRM|nr:glycogen debranching N-terminal domain-containing protein [Limnochorda sp. L945t]WRP17749.1 glycogen debranching N-terminal domain-containing protein [Limnochorda sp. L945t]
MVLKEGGLFAVLTPEGECPGEGALGLYFRDTRYVHRYRVSLGDTDGLALLGSGQEAPYVARLFATSAGRTPGRPIPSHAVAVWRTLVVTGSAWMERTRLTNHHYAPLHLRWRVDLGSDFGDMMGIRTGQTSIRGHLEPPRAIEGDRWALGYRGADGVARHLVCSFSGGAEVRPGGEGSLVAEWAMVLEPGQTFTLVTWMAPHEGSGPLPAPSRSLEDEVDQALERDGEGYAAWQAATAGVRTSCEALNRLLERGAQDIRALVSDFGEGPFPVAGIPWFAVPFGRDSLWTAYFLLPYAPQVARAVLRTLARYQAAADDPWTDAEPGKILHELRFGELVRLGVLPHKPYYGSVDATPLFAALAADFTRRAADRDGWLALEGPVRAALDWMDRFGDLDGDGFLEYRRRSPAGLDNQGWKDAHDSVWHADGQLAVGPIALVEVQAYRYRALRGLAHLLSLLGHQPEARRLEAQAQELARRWDEAFWMPRLRFYAHALDGAGRPVEVITSNPAHALWAGIVPEERAPHVAAHLLGPELFSGWGLRTVASGQARFNPMSYHNGSVWPHDTAIAAGGLSTYGFGGMASRLARSVVESSRFFPDARLPELFCGFSASMGPPVPYPTACSPQAWAAAAPFQLVSALLGLEVDGMARTVRLHDRIPAWLGEVIIERLAVADALVDVRVRPCSGQVTPPGGGDPDRMVEAEVHLSDRSVRLLRTAAERQRLRPARPVP